MAGKNIGNPYMKEPNRFGNKDNYDWLRFIPEAEKPVDFRGRNIRPAMPDTYAETTQEYYDEATRYLEKHPDLLKNINFRNRKQITELVDKINDAIVKESRKTNHRTAEGLSCYRVAGYVAAIFDNQKIPYKCFAGSAYYKGDSWKYEFIKQGSISGKRGANHVWIQAFGATSYEYFNGENNIEHFTINDELKFKKK